MTTLEQLRNVDLAEDLIQANWKHSRRNIVLVLEDLDFTWDEDDMLKVAELWKRGVDVRDIADTMQRPDDEVALCLMDLSRKGKIKPRMTGPLTNKLEVHGGLTKEIYLQRKAQGRSQISIRKEFGVTQSEFYYWLRKWGVK